VFLGAPIVVVVALIFGLVVVLVPATRSVAVPDCVPLAPGDIEDVHLDEEQLRIAAVIIDVSRELGVPARGWVVALAAGMQESGLRPLDYGDRDSLGVFQQRTAWGTVAQRLDPTSAARMFFTGGHAGQRGLLDVPGWADMSVTAAAQAVQVSAYPDAYATWENLAIRLVNRLGHVDTGCEPAGPWVSPLAGASYVLTAGFGECGSHWSACHTGLDLAAPTGTPVVAGSAGVVTFAGWDGAYGNAVHILHTDGLSTWYAHLSRIDSTRGARVDAGDLVGLVGATGNTTGPHLHLEVRRASSATTDGTPVDPLAWLRSHGAV
jgi:murein DD-endopeptidase MepM/ murein hydrolase activator NlpD